MIFNTPAHPLKLTGTVFKAIDPLTGERDSYISLAIRTASPLNDRQNLLHAVLGIADELVELGSLIRYEQPVEGAVSAFEKFNLALIKELGDITWFTALFADWVQKVSLDVDANTLFTQMVETSTNNFLATKEVSQGDTSDDLISDIYQEGVYGTVGRCISLTKKEYAYGKPMSLDAAQRLFEEALTIVMTVTGEKNIPFLDVLDRNIEKLSARYKKATFTQEEAINRDETKE
jgi:hypothetical protein